MIAAFNWKTAAPLSTALLAVLCLFTLQSALAQKRQPYDDRNCTTCHGVDGKGNYGVRAPKLAGMEPWYLTRQLEHFREGVRGFHSQDIDGRGMGAAATALSDERIAELVDWVGTWDAMPAEVTLQGDIAAGEKLYAECAICHGAKAEGNETFGAPALRGQNDWYLLTQMQYFRDGLRGTDPRDILGMEKVAVVRNMPDNSDAAFIDVISYINALGQE